MTRDTRPEPFDVLGIGFGPANLALAIALEEEAPEVRAHFLEAQADPVWQSGMLLDGSDIQNHPSRDLVTLRNPRSRYSYLNYLYENACLVEHLNLPARYPLRKEYARYISWATAFQADRVHFGSPVTRIELEPTADGSLIYAATTAEGYRARGRSLVVGTGRTPLIPPAFAELCDRDPRVFHLTRYLHRIDRIPGPVRRVAVIGGSQSAVEIALDLNRRLPEAEITTYVRAFSLRSKDHSPFSEEGYFPEFTDSYYRADRRGKQALDAYMRPTNYSASDLDVLEQLYQLIHEQRLDHAQRVFVRGNCVVQGVGESEGRLMMQVQDLQSGQVEHTPADAVILATGFRDLGPGAHQESHPPLLDQVIDRFRIDEDGYLAVNVDYSLKPLTPDTPPLFLNGLCESSHGIGDAGSFSLLSVRAGRILAAVRKSLHVTTPAAAANV